MKFVTTKFTDGTEHGEERLIEHSLYGFMFAKWNTRPTIPRWEAVGFRPDDTSRTGEAHPLVLLNLFPADIDRIKRWASIEPIS